MSHKTFVHIDTSWISLLHAVKFSQVTRHISIFSPKVAIFLEKKSLRLTSNSSLLELLLITITSSSFALKSSSFSSKFLSLSEITSTFSFYNEQLKKTPESYIVFDTDFGKRHVFSSSLKSPCKILLVNFRNLLKSQFSSLHFTAVWNLKHVISKFNYSFSFWWNQK